MGPVPPMTSAVLIGPLWHAGASIRLTMALTCVLGYRMESTTQYQGVANVATKAGERLDFDGGVQVIVTKGGEGDVTASSGGEGLKVGKRYQDEDTGIEVLVTKPGAVTLQCNGKDMALQEPKKTKSAD